MSRRGRVVAALAVTTLAAGAGACGSSRASTSSTSTSAPSLTVENFQFSPNPTAVKVGDTITIHNADDTDHTFTADDHSIDTGRIAAGGKASVRIGQPGVFRYHCNIHTYMTGTLNVAQ